MGRKPPLYSTHSYINRHRHAVTTKQQRQKHWGTIPVLGLAGSGSRTAESESRWVKTIALLYYCRKYALDTRVESRLLYYQYFSFLFFNLTYIRWTSSLPSCLWSQRIFPFLLGSRLTIFLSRCKFSTLTTRQPTVEFYLITFPRFPLRKKEHKSYFGKNRTHDFRTSRCADYLLDHSGDDFVVKHQTRHIFTRKATRSFISDIIYILSLLYKDRSPR